MPQAGLNDTICFEDRHSKMADAIKGKYNFFEKDKNVIGIAGKSGAGKTECAMKLQAKLTSMGIPSYISSLDSFYVLNPLERTEKRKTPGHIIGINEIDWLKVYHMVGDFKDAKYFRDRYWDKHLQNYIYAGIPSELPKVLIIEGLYACTSVFNFDYKVMIDVTNDETYQFRKNRKKEDADDSFRKHVLEKEALDVDRIKGNVDLVLSYNGDIKT